MTRPSVIECLIYRAHSEISSCNYKARSFGVTKGLWMGRAKEVCPELVILPYDYDNIRRVGNTKDSHDVFNIKNNPYDLRVH